ncbi:lactonase family protein [Lichenicoccus sp.]|uniref:lactonase family protein n=1 Tax=Lichenicoccus sp. TaxID=2781899 RepID=UPI003D0FD93F
MRAPRYAYIGCFTTATRGARGDGIDVHAIDPATGAWTRIQHLAGLVNPSFLVLAPDRRTLYAVHGDAGYASAFARDEATGLLRPLGQAATGGSNVVHQAIAPSGRHLVIANYGSGSVAVLPIGDDGSLAPFSFLAPMPGSPGPHRVEQAGSHPHQILFDPSGRFVLVPDKGHDDVAVFAFDADRGTLELHSVLASRPGAGPRHAAFHPSRPVCWVLNELNSSVTTCRWASGRLEPVAVIPTLPGTFSGASTAAAIATTTDGRIVYASNRGHDSIAAFATDAADGRLRQLGWTRAPGRGPRFMALQDDILFVASEQDDLIGRFVPGDGGVLDPAGEIVPSLSPVTIAFA